MAIVLAASGLLFLFILVVADNTLVSLSRHMLQHAVIMNVLAPAAAWAIYARAGVDHFAWSPMVLVAVTSAQLIMLWVWHIPAIFTAAHAQIGILTAMHISLAVSALLFWIAVIGNAREYAFRSVFALLITGKLYCLYGVLLIFASRELFHAMDYGHHVISQSDQQLAGLIMITACPLTYVAAAVAIVAIWLKEIDRPTHARAS